MGCTPSALRRRVGKDTSEEPSRAQRADRNLNRKKLSEKDDTKLDSSIYVSGGNVQLTKNYLKEKKLGSGAFGQVWQCKYLLTNESRAVKIVKKAELSFAESDAIMKEVSLLKGLDHPNLMKIHEFLNTPKALYICVELYKGGELFDRILSEHHFDEHSAAMIMKQVFSGVAYLHKNHIVHRDLKPENILFETRNLNSRVKVVDFGLSAHFEDKKAFRERTGTAYYIAPEVLTRTYNHLCDMWSCGVVMYILLCGYPPFAGRSDSEIIAKVRRGKVEYPANDWENVSPAAIELLKGLLVVDSTKRLSAAKALNSEWIKKFGNASGFVDSKPLMNVARKLRRFQGPKKLAHAAMLYIASRAASVSEKESLTQLFVKLDINGDGFLERSELIDGLQAFMREDCTVLGETLNIQVSSVQEQVDDILRSCDLNKNGYIDYSEFVAMCLDRAVLLSKNRLKAAFDVLDEDGSGEISRKELSGLYGYADMSPELWREVIGGADKDGDDQISFDEFVDMMRVVCDCGSPARSLEPSAALS